MLTLITGFLALPLLLCCVLGGMVFYFDFYNRLEKIKDTRANREVKLTHFKYDPNGNPEYYYNPATGDYFVPGNGNPLNPPQNLFINGVQQSLKSSNKRPVLFNTKGENQEDLHTEELPEELPEKQNRGETSGNILRSLEETGEYLQYLKDNGVKKGRALELIGVKAGRNIGYNTWGPYWDSLVVAKDKGPLS